MGVRRRLARVVVVPNAPNVAASMSYVVTDKKNPGTLHSFRSEHTQPIARLLTALILNANSSSSNSSRPDGLLVLEMCRVGVRVWREPAGATTQRAAHLVLPHLKT